MRRKVAFIKEDDCVGCNKCLAKCPVDAIIGSVNKIHNILVESCIGCNLCVDICPTDCIKIEYNIHRHYIINNIHIKYNRVLVKDID